MGSLAAVANKTHLTGAFDFTSDVTLVLGATTGFFPGQDFVLSAHKLAEYFAVAESGEAYLAAAKNAGGVTWLFHQLKGNIFNADIILLSFGGSGHGWFALRFRGWPGSTGRRIIGAAA